jgi:acylphosphatase
MAQELREIWYSGHVQGVGFRFTVASLARRFAIGGYVQNLPDGRVHLVCEGEKSEVQGLLSEVGQRMEGYIRDTREDCRPASGRFATFEIRH